MTRLQQFPLSELTFDNIQTSYGFKSDVEKLPLQDAEFFQRYGIPTSFSKSSVVFRQGGQVRGVHLLVQGKIKVYRDLMPGQRQIFHFHRQGELLGCRQIILDEAYTFQAEALEDCQTIFIPADQFLLHLRQSASFAQYLLELQSREFSAWSNNYSLIARRSVRVRLAVCLLNLHEIYQLPGNQTAVIYLSRTDLADYAATTLETTVRMLREMKETGLIHIRGRRIVLLDIPALMQISRDMKMKKIEA